MPIQVLAISGPIRSLTTLVASLTECIGAGILTGRDCDESPLITTHQGGLTGYIAQLVSLRPIPSTHNRHFGTKIWAPAAGVLCGSKGSKNVIVVPYGPQSFYFVNGKYGPKE